MKCVVCGGVGKKHDGPLWIDCWSCNPKPKEKPMNETEHIEQFFAFAHLPQHLQEVSKPFGELASFILTLPRNPERSVALRKLLEAKDAAVRARLAR